MHECSFFNFPDPVFKPTTTITVVPPSTTGCTNFTDVLVDDNIPFEKPQNFTIIVDNSTAWVQTIDDDSKICKIIC